MVKRIKKRIPKKEEPEQTAEPTEGEEAAEEESGLRAELSSIAEDEFTEKTAKFFQWILDNRLPVLGSIALGAVLLIGLSIYQRAERQSREEAAASFSIASEAYVGALEAEAKDSDEHAAKLKKARDAFEETLKGHAGEEISTVAALGLAGAEYDLGNYKQAINYYEKARSKDGLDVFTQVIILQGRAAAEESAGEIDKAIQTWRVVSNLDRRVYGLMAALEIGRLLEASEKAPEALAHYKKVLEDKENEALFEDMSNRVVKHELEQRVARLGGST